MNRRTFYMFMSPSLLVMLLLMVFPLLTSIWLSMQFMTFRNINTPEFVGLANYLAVFDDRKFWQAFSFTMTFIALAVPLQISSGLFDRRLCWTRSPVRIRGDLHRRLFDALHRGTCCRHFDGQAACSNRAASWLGFFAS